MGLFSSKKVYTVDTTTTRIIEDERLVDTLQGALINSIIGNEGITPSLINAIPGSVGVRADKMVRHINASYPQGMMRTRVTSNRGQLGAIRARVEANTGRSGIEILYAQLTLLNFNHLAYQRLVAVHGYNPVTNELSGLSGSMGGQVYLKDFTILVPQDDYSDARVAGTTTPFDQGPTSGYTPQRRAAALAPFVISAETLIGEDRDTAEVVVDWVRQAPGGAINEGSLTLPLVIPANDLEVFQVKYRHQGSVYYWSYTHKAGTDPVLDGLYDVPTTRPASMMPVIYFRRNHQNLSHESRSDSEQYKAAEKALDILGISYGEMGDAIHENPDIGVVRNSYILFGASTKSTSTAVHRYLYDFFRDLVLESADLEASQGNAFGYGIEGLINREDTGRLSIRMTPNQSLGNNQIGADMNLTVRSVGARLVGGKIGKVGSYQITQVTNSHTYDQETKVQLVSGSFGSLFSKRTRSFPALRIRKQVTKSTYHEVMVNDPVLRHNIDGSGRGTNNGLGDEDLVIPIDYNRIRSWGTRDKEMLLQSSLHLIFNVFDVQKVKWYQTGMFKIVLVVAAIVIAAFTGQFQFIALAFATGGILAVAWVIAVAIVKSLVIQYAFKVIAEQIGGELALYIAVAMAVYGMARGMQAGSLEDAPWAEELLMAASAMGKASAAQFGVELEALSAEYDDLLGIEEEREAELERARSLLNTNSNMLNPLNFVLGEKPDNFYQRTVHSGNIGTLAFDAIHNYVDASLHLPGT